MHTGAGLCQHLCPRQEKKGGRVAVGTSYTGRYQRVQAVRPGSVAGRGCYGIMEFDMACRIKPKRKYAHISNEGNWAQFWMIRQKVKESYVMNLEFIRLKVAQIGPCWC